MQVIRSLEAQHHTLVGFGVRLVLVSPETPDNILPHRLAGLGGVVEQRTELYEALEALIEDPFDYGLCVIDCDAIGGLEAGRRAVQMLSVTTRRVPVILISSECKGQEFPVDTHAPVVLRGPASAVSMRVGFEHALRDRLASRLI